MAKHEVLFMSGGKEVGRAPLSDEVKFTNRGQPVRVTNIFVTGLQVAGMEFEYDPGPGSLPCWLDDGESITILKLLTTGEEITGKNLKETLQ